MGELKRYGLIRYSTKTGRADKALTGLGCGMLQMWGIQNTPKSKTSVVFELETGLIRSRYIGTKDGFPNVEHGIESKGEYIDEHIRAAIADEDGATHGDG